MKKISVLFTLLTCLFLVVSAQSTTAKKNYRKETAKMMKKLSPEAQKRIFEYTDRELKVESAVANHQPVSAIMPPPPPAPPVTATAPIPPKPPVAPTAPVAATAPLSSTQEAAARTANTPVAARAANAPTLISTSDAPATTTMSITSPTPVAESHAGHDHSSTASDPHAGHDHQSTQASLPSVTPATSPNSDAPEYMVKAEQMAKTTIKWDKDSHDFGKINEGDKVKHRFTFQNTGSNPLLVTMVKPSCGCTATEWSKEEIAPNGKGFVEVEFNSTGKAGSQRKNVSVFLNTDPVLQSLTFIGDVEPKKIEEEKKE